MNQHLGINPLNDPSVEAICFLKKDGDEKNCLYFTRDDLTIIIKGRVHRISNELIKKISVGNRLLLGPIVAGGIIFPLATLAFFGDYANPFLLMLLIIGGILLLMYGFGGSTAITIDTAGGSEHYFISKMGDNIINFINYFNSKKFDGN